jgi:hypothetical protein
VKFDKSGKAKEKHCNLGTYAIFFVNNRTVRKNINLYRLIWKTPVEVNCGERLKTNNSLSKPF